MNTTAKGAAMKSTTPTFRVEFERVVSITEGRRVSWTSQGYDCKRAGRPTDENLALYIEGLEHSTLPGECNEHLGITRIGAARIVRQSNNETVATYAPGLFTVAS